MDRNTIIALLLIGLIILLTPVYMRQFGVQQIPIEEGPVQEQMDSLPEETKQALQEALIRRDREKETVQTRAESIPAAVQEKIEEELIVIDTELYKGKVSSVGGGTIVSWELKNHLFGAKENDQPVNLLFPESRGNLGLFLGERSDLRTKPFVFEADSQWTDQGRRLRMLRFSYDLEPGSRILKELLFEDGKYDFNLSVYHKTENPSQRLDNYEIHWPWGIASTEEQVSDERRYLQASAMQGGELVSTKEKPTGILTGSTDWAAIRSKYFLTAMIPEKNSKAVSLQGDTLTVAGLNGQLFDWRRLEMFLIFDGRERTASVADVTIYLGPMDYDALKDFDVNLERLMNFGWTVIRPISILFYHVLQYLNRQLGNFGWAIIVFAILIKIALYPLTRKSFQHMKDMQAHQPKLQAIREKYKGDNQRIQQETMEYYKKQGVNPAAPMLGCLPLLLQMPVLFALFNLFRTTIMLRQAEFMGIIQDLSAPDRMIGQVNVLPIVMGGTMIIQQKLSSGNNPQQKMMAYFMPIFMAYIFYNMSAGLNLYYLIFNILTIAQELIVKKKKKPEQE